VLAATGLFNAVISAVQDVTAAGTVAQLADRVELVRAFVFLVWPGAIVIRMAGRAIRLIRRVRPGNALIVLRMTTDAGDIRPVIAGIIRRHMAVALGGYPGSCRMAGIAL